MNEQPVRQIRPHTKRNGICFCLVGVVGLLAVILIHQLISPLPWPVQLAFVFISLVALALGVAKLLEPDTSLHITPQEITYLHRKGRWTLKWDCILRFDIPRVHRGLHLQELPFLGFRLTDYDALLTQLSPRLAVHLLTEQRQLMIVALRSEKPATTSYTEYFDVPMRFRSSNGVVYTGVLATFAMRMQHMRELLGYDLYISQNAFDRPVNDFRAMLLELQHTRQAHF